MPFSLIFQAIGFRQILVIMSLILMLALSGCGKKGPLYLPDKADNEQNSPPTSDVTTTPTIPTTQETP